MEKVDRYVALVGALILAAAVVAVALSEPGAAAAWRVSHPLSPQGVEGDLGAAGVGAAQQPSAEILVEGPDVHSLHVNVTLSAQAAFGPGGSVTVTLTAPNGTTYEASAAPPAAGSTMSVPLDVPVAPLPPPATVNAASEEGAREAAAALDAPSTAGAGTWTLTVAYAAGLAPVGVSFDYAGTILRWSDEVAREAPPEVK